MKIFLKIVATFFFFIAWGWFAKGCRDASVLPGAKSVSGLFTLVLFFAGTYGIWKYNPSKNSSTDETKLKKD